MHKMIPAVGLFAVVLVSLLWPLAGRAAAEDQWAVLEGKDGPGKGKHIVLIAADDEYRSEELIPALAKILAARHGFKCTVLFAVNKQTGEIDPSTMDNIPGLEALKTADMLIVSMRFRELPDEQMKFIIDYVDSGKPVMGQRTSTHAFNYTKHKDSPYAKYSFNNKEFQGGFGRQILGETWVNHWGAHQKESTRGLIAPGMEASPIVKGCEDIWGPSDVYTINSLTGDAKPVIMGQVLKGMDPKDAPNDAKKQMPVAWTKTYTGAQGKASRVFNTTMGHNGDFVSEGFRRLLVNATYWCVGMEDKIPAKANVELVGEYKPSPIGVGKFVKGKKPSDVKP
jgi:type 1 glutamine amidotransferase